MRKRTRPPRLPSGPAAAFVKHGSVSTYKNMGCRCIECRAAAAAYARDLRARRKAES